MKQLADSRRMKSEHGGEPVGDALAISRCCSLKLSGKHARRSQAAKALEVGDLRAMEDMVGDAVVAAAGDVEVDVEMEGRRAQTNMTRVTLSASSVVPMATMPTVAPVRRRTRRRTMRG
jgi:hypothetical protein